MEELRHAVDVAARSRDRTLTLHVLVSDFDRECKERVLVKNTKLLACVTTHSQVPLPLIFLSSYTFTVLPALSALHQTHACSKSNASTAKSMAFALSHTLAPTSGTISHKTSGALLLFLQKPTHFSSQNISVKPHCPSLPSVCTVCVCECV